MKFAALVCMMCLAALAPGKVSAQDYTLLKSQMGAGCIDTSGSTANGRATHLWECNASNGNQPWFIDANGYIRAKSNPNKCLDPRGPSYAQGTVIQMWDCQNNYLPQQWVYMTDGTIRPKGDTSKCIDVAEGSTNDGTSLHLWTCHGGSNQRWDRAPINTTPPLVCRYKGCNEFCEDDEGEPEWHGKCVFLDERGIPLMGWATYCCE